MRASAPSLPPLSGPGPAGTARRWPALGVPGLAVAALAFAAVLFRLLFWKYTDRTWEDALITVLHVENFWQGHGLTHVKPGQAPLHGFTSPISIIVPLIGGIVNQGQFALAFQKLVSAFAGAGVVLVAYQLMKMVALEQKQLLVWGLAALTYMALEHHQILWGMAGMETTVVTLTLFFFFYACARQSVPLIAAAMALSLYARPDFLFLNVIGLVYALAFMKRADVTRAVGFAFLLYLPWLVFTTAYYGSPIPNTITAKFNGYPFPDVKLFDKFIDLVVPTGPSFSGHGTGYWRDWDKGTISVLVFGFFCLGAYQAVVRKAQALYVPIAFVVVYWMYYVFLVAGVFGWYLVPVSATTVLVAAYGLVTTIPHASVAGGVAALYVASILAVLPANVRAERDIQRYIETPVRQALGLHLNQVMKPTDRIVMEPLGYSSYYSRRAIYDYPGLASRPVVEFLKTKPKAGLCATYQHFQPEYIALRGFECKGDPLLASRYELVKEFRAAPPYTAIKLVQYNIDNYFLLYKRKD